MLEVPSFFTFTLEAYLDNKLKKQSSHNKQTTIARPISKPAYVQEGLSYANAAGSVPAAQTTGQGEMAERISEFRKLNQLCNVKKYSTNAK